MSTHYLFGYGSLVCPDSIARTIGRTPSMDSLVDVELNDYGRVWNYGAPAGDIAWTVDGRVVDNGVIVFLSIEHTPGASCGGTVFAVDDTELAALDRRERYYDRVDVTAHVSVVSPALAGCTIQTYLPRREAIERYQNGRANGVAAVEQRYVDLVRNAFDRRGGLATYTATTPLPDVPVVQTFARTN